MSSLYKTDGAAPLGKGSLVPAGAITDQELFNLLKGYRRRVVSSYRSLLPEEISTRLVAEPMYVSPKIDGELWFLVECPTRKLQLRWKSSSKVLLPALVHECWERRVGMPAT